MGERLKVVQREPSSVRLVRLASRQFSRAPFKSVGCMLTAEQNPIDDNASCLRASVDRTLRKFLFHDGGQVRSKVGIRPASHASGLEAHFTFDNCPKRIPCLASAGAEKSDLPPIEACWLGSPQRPEPYGGGMEPGIIERALELAPECATITQVKHKLKAEGYAQIEAHLSGRFIRQQISERLIPTGKKRRIR